MKKLFLSAALLLVAATLLGTSTFAWFSMNKTVTATGMSVTCQNDQIYLLIMAGEKTASDVQTNNKTTANAENASHSLLPAGHDTIAKKSEADTASKWFTAEATSVSASTMKTGTKTALTDGNISSYVLINTFTLTVAKDTNDMKDIMVDEIKIYTTGDRAVKVLVATSSAVEEFSSELGTGETDTATKKGTVTLQSALTDSTVMVVSVYVYWDGDDTDVYTTGAADLKNTTVEITFTGTVDTTE